MGRVCLELESWGPDRTLWSPDLILRQWRPGMVREQEVAPPNSHLGRSVFHQKASGWWGREGALSGDFAVGQGRGQG